MVNPLSGTGWEKVIPKNTKEEFERTAVLFMRDFGYTPDEFWEIEWPTFLFMLNTVNEEDEKTKNSMPKVPRGRI